MASNVTFDGTLAVDGGDSAVEQVLHLDEGVPWYRQLELVLTLTFAIFLAGGIAWHLMTIREWAEESLQYVEMAAMESAQYAQQAQNSSPSKSKNGASPKLSATSSRVIDGAKAVAGAGKDTVLFAPRALVSAGVSLKYRLHNVIDDIVATAESLSPKWRFIWIFGDLVILALALTVLMFIPGSFLLLFVGWTAIIVRCDGGDSHASALDMISDMVASSDMAGVSHHRSKDSSIRVANPLLNSTDLEDGEQGSTEDGGKLLADKGPNVLFVGQKSDKVSREEARALHTMLLLQQEQYAQQREAQERTRALEERRQAAKKMFEETDTDGNGTLDVEELQELAKRMGVDLTLEQAHLAFSDIDEDGSGEIDFDEFFQFYEANMSAPGGLKAGFGSFFSGFSLRLRTVGLHSKPISRAGSTATSSGDQSSSTNKKLSSLKGGKMASSDARLGRSRDGPSNSKSSIDRPIDNVRQHLTMPPSCFTFTASTSLLAVECLACGASLTLRRLIFTFTACTSLLDVKCLAYVASLTLRRLNTRRSTLMLW